LYFAQGATMRIDVLTALGIPAATPMGSGPLAQRDDVSRRAAASGAVTQQAPVEPVTDIAGAVRQIESYLKSEGRSLEFRVDAETNRTVITVRNTTNGEVIRQIPNEEVLQLARFLTQGSAGSLNVKV
jgi:uncharacterized FlaG/YvyC family protein